MTEEKVLRLAKDRLLYLASNEEKYLSEVTMINELPIERILILAYEELDFILQSCIEKRLGLNDLVFEKLNEIKELKELAKDKGLCLKFCFF